MVAGKIAVVAGYGAWAKVGQLCAASRPKCGSLRSTHLRVAGRHGRLRVVTMDYAATRAESFVTATGNYKVITHDQWPMKNQAIVCNIGHFDNEIEWRRWRTTPGGDQAQVDHIIFPTARRHLLLAKGLR